MNSLAHLRLPTVLLFAAAFAPLDERIDAPRAADLSQRVDRCRTALGVAHWQASGQELLLEGSSIEEGMEGPWRLRVSADGRFAGQHDTRFPTRFGFDGESTWSVDRSGLATRGHLEAREQALLSAALWSGTWCSEQGPLAIYGESDGELLLRPRNGELAARVAIDPASSLPNRLTIETYRGDFVYEYSGWSALEGGLQVARDCRLDDSGRQSRWHVQSAQFVAPEPDAFAFPATRPTDTTFDPSRPALLTCKIARTRHLLVRAELDGVDHGYWIFDSGAGGLVIDPKLAQKLGYEPYGELWIGGAGAARTATHYYEARSLRVGPATLDRPRLSSLDLDALSATLGAPLVGIIGYDFLQRVVATVDMKAGRIEIADPATFTRVDATWRALTLHGHHPHVECSFGHEGEESALFRLDTGAAGVAVIFHSPFVQESGLLTGRPTAPFNGLSGVGGESKARIGLIDWFELGGVVVDQPTAIFVEDAHGALADPWTAGTLGGDLLEKSDLIFDYPHDRVGFAPRRAAK